MCIRCDGAKTRKNGEMSFILSLEIVSTYITISITTSLFILWHYIIYFFKTVHFANGLYGMAIILIGLNSVKCFFMLFKNMLYKTINYFRGSNCCVLHYPIVSSVFRIKSDL